MSQDAESTRLQEAATLESSRSQLKIVAAKKPWRKWGPYLSERQWGTVREDYSQDGNAWDYFTHDQARSRAYHWGEDGLAGISDFNQRLCFSVALWNGKDPILKERAFGLTNSEANHGEDVKEYYFDTMVSQHLDLCNTWTCIDTAHPGRREMPQLPISTR